MSRGSWSMSLSRPSESRSPKFEFRSANVEAQIQLRTSTFDTRTAHIVLRTLSSVVCLALLFVAPGCGYRLAGKATAIPPNVDTVAIPMFTNRSTKYRLEQRLTAAVVDEFISRTHYRI